MPDKKYGQLEYYGLVVHLSLVIIPRDWDLDRFKWFTWSIIAILVIWAQPHLPEWLIVSIALVISLGAVEGYWKHKDKLLKAELRKHIQKGADLRELLEATEQAAGMIPDDRKDHLVRIIHEVILETQSNKELLRPVEATSPDTLLQAVKTADQDKSGLLHAVNSDSTITN